MVENISIKGCNIGEITAAIREALLKLILFKNCLKINIYIYILFSTSPFYQD